MALSTFLFEQSSRRQRQKELKQDLLDQVGHQLRFEDPVDDERIKILQFFQKGDDLRVVWN